MRDVELPFPPAALSGHTNGGWQAKAALTKQHRAWAKHATLAMGWTARRGTRDIAIIVTFYPPDRRTDRCNMPNRVKPYWDGIADAMGVNDRQFLPRFIFSEPVTGGRVVFSLEDVHEKA